MTPLPGEAEALRLAKRAAATLAFWHAPRYAELGLQDKALATWLDKEFPPSVVSGASEERKPNTAWLIERYYEHGVRLPMPKYLVVLSGSYEWTEDANNATRFPTKYDATIMGNCVLGNVHDYAWKMEEHRWCSGPDLSVLPAPEPTAPSGRKYAWYKEELCRVVNGHPIADSHIPPEDRVFVADLLRGEK